MLHPLYSLSITSNIVLKALVEVFVRHAELKTQTDFNIKLTECTTALSDTTM